MSDLTNNSNSVNNDEQRVRGTLDERRQAVDYAFQAQRAAVVMIARAKLNNNKDYLNTLTVLATPPTL